MHIQLFAFGERQTRSFHIEIALGIFSFFFFRLWLGFAASTTPNNSSTKINFPFIFLKLIRLVITRLAVAVVIILSYFILFSSVHHAMVLLLNFCRPPAFLLCVFLRPSVCRPKKRLVTCRPLHSNTKNRRCARFSSSTNVILYIIWINAVCMNFVPVPKVHITLC